LWFWRNSQIIKIKNISEIHGAPRLKTTKKVARDKLKKMTILILNLGSTSFKYALYGADDLRLLQKGNYEMETDMLHDIQDVVDKSFREVLREVGGVENISAVGHRVVHGGDKYFETTEITTENLKDLADCNDLAPLHNPYNLAGIKASLKYLSDVKNYAVFDTAFFSDLPDVAKIYPIPEEYFEQGIHRFGFHGTSHKFVAQQACSKLKLDVAKANLITVHLGGGCSVTAIQNGKPIETSMGWTPLEGLMMQTRSGDIDPGIILELAEKEGIEETRKILNKQSGIKAISGCENYLELLENVKHKEERAMLAFEMFINRIKKYIGAYSAILDKVDAIVFTGAIGAGDKMTRQKVCDKMKLLDGVKIVAIETDEELAIAQEISKIQDTSSK
jgi:acetate kinase